MVVRRYAVDRDTARARLLHTAQQAHQRRFARAVLTDHAEYRRTVDGKIELVERDVPAVITAKLFSFYNILFFAHTPPPRLRSMSHSSSTDRPSTDASSIIASSASLSAAFLRYSYILSFASFMT